MKITENFNSVEFDCKDGTPYPPEWIDERLKPLCEALEKIRTKIQAPLHILSGYRTVEHNKKVGGKPRSMHLYGLAADIVCRKLKAKELGIIIEGMIANNEIPNGGLGKYPSFIHYDLRKIPARWVK